MLTVFAIHADPGSHLTVSRAIASLRHVELAGRSRSAVEALRVFDTLAPDAVTVDVRLPDGDGIELARTLLARRPGLGVVMFGAPTHGLLRRALAVGVRAYVPATAGDADATAAIQTCLSGGASFSSDILAAALRSCRPVDLSRREREVDGLFRTGLSTADVAALLAVSESTVRTYVARVRAKLGTDAAVLVDERLELPPVG